MIAMKNKFVLFFVVGVLQNKILLCDEVSAPLIALIRNVESLYIDLVPGAELLLQVNNLLADQFEKIETISNQQEYSALEQSLLDADKLIENYIKSNKDLAEKLYKSSEGRKTLNTMAAAVEAAADKIASLINPLLEKAKKLKLSTDKLQAINFSLLGYKSLESIWEEPFE